MSFVASCLLSVIHKQWLEQLRRPITTYDHIPGRFLMCHQYEISVAESKRTPAVMSEEKCLFSPAIKGLATKHIASKQGLCGTLVAGERKERFNYVSGI